MVKILAWNEQSLDRSCSLQFVNKTVKEAVARKPSRPPSNWQITWRICSFTIPTNVLLRIEEKTRIDQWPLLLYPVHAESSLPICKSIPMGHTTLHVIPQAKTTTTVSGLGECMAHESIPYNDKISAGSSQLALLFRSRRLMVREIPPGWL
jgi:hypothetical protein